MSYELTLLPAVDVMGGQAVQLVQGKAGSQKVFGDPYTAAQRWVDDGAQWLHIVDLDGAFGTGNNAALLAELIARLTETDPPAGHPPVQVELSGGIRDDQSLQRALATGCRRINLGTAALERPQWCAEVIAEFGDRIAVGLDVRGENLAARGWTFEGGNVFEALERLNAAGCARYVVTDVASDGMLTGPNLELLGAICARTDAPVIASGGISHLTDLQQLRGLVPIGVEGAIIGTALYVGNFTLPDALAVSSGQIVAPQTQVRESPAAADQPVN